ncbi:sulfatase-like hydrolase/transferase [Nostoc sp. C110]|uniref:sulfatase-like hydrolase/transferase n=1 Tax=Nostoc sp. C110 TaxID=3349876 RepID=UPI00370D04A7
MLSLIFRAIALSLVIILLMVSNPALAATSKVLPIRPPSFEGEIGTTYKESTPDFPAPITAPKNAPNVLLVLLDDVGFGQASTFGGSIETPNLTRLAEKGLRYNQFHTTALCSPTRAALLTGRNHHSVGTGVVAELATGYPGYTTILPKSAATVAEVLRQNGYNTAAFGKWHNTPDYETSAVGPFDRWPTGLGFEYFYGFMGGDTNQWSPALVERTKQIASHFGGTRNPLVVAWGNQIKDRGGLRSQFHHVIDITPTILEATGITVPTEVNGVKQQKIEGTSLVYTFDDPDASSQRKTQYFEMFGNRAIYNNGWIAAARHPRLPWQGTINADFEQDPWELYNIEEDFSEANNLADKNPEKLEKLQKLFLSEARKHKVLPLDDRVSERFDVKIRPSLDAGRTTFIYYPGAVPIPEGSAPNLKNRSFTIKADVEIPENGAEGVLLTQGGRFAGWGFFLEDGKPTYTYNFANAERYIIQSPEKLPPGKATIGFDFDYDGGVGAGGTGKLFIDNQQVAQGRIEKTIPYRVALDETFDVGRDTGTPVVDTYQVPFAFTGNLQKVILNLK